MKSIRFLLVPLFCISYAFSQQMLGDINSTTPEAKSSPRGFRSFKDGFVFVANTLEFGNEIWWSDGSPNGAHLLKDIFPGPLPGTTSFTLNTAVSIADTLYFLANDGTRGSQIYRTDGTPSGTFRISNFNHSISSLSTYQGQLFYSVNDVVQGTVELWKGSGQIDDFQLVKGSISSMTSLKGMYVANNLLFFSVATSGETELWRTDGTDLGTYAILENVDGIGVGNSSSQFSHYIEFQGKLYVIIRNSGFPYLYESDGTITGTQIVSPIISGFNELINQGSAIVANGEMYFSFAKLSSPYKFYLYKSDGTQLGTSQVALLTSSAVYGHSNLLADDDCIYFLAPGGTGTDLTRYHMQLGTLESVKHLSPLDSMTIQTESAHIAAGDSGTKTLYLPRRISLANRDGQLWRTDGTTAGTYDLQAGIVSSQQVAVGDTFFFASEDSIGDKELYYSDGNIAGTGLLQNIDQSISSLTVNSSSIIWDNSMWIYLDDGMNGGELWRTDGTPSGTSLFRDINPTGSSLTLNFHPFNGKLFFSANDGNGQELWTTDGTIAGTELVVDLVSPVFPPTLISSFPGNFENKGGHFYFTAHYNAEIWRTDGTSNGTEFVIAPGAPPATTNYLVGNLTELNGEIFFATGITNALWKTNGNIGDITRIVDGLPISTSFIPINGEMYFVARDSQGEEVWKSDGTASGTTIIKDVYPPTGQYISSNPEPFGLIAGTNELFFFQDDRNHGRELWKTDGTETGTVMVKDIFPGTKSGIKPGFDFEVEFMNGEIYFVAWDGTHGYELWKSDGTEIGTQMVYDIHTGIESSHPFNFYVDNGHLYFAVYEPATGVELWETDGSTIGTKRLTDINPGIGNSNPEPLGMLGTNLIFSALDGITGRELWAFDITTDIVKPLKEGAYVSLFPNPATESIHLTWDTPIFGNVEASILTLQGKMVDHFQLEVYQKPYETTFSIDNLAAGAYIVVLKHGGGKTIRKFIKQ